MPEMCVDCGERPKTNGNRCWACSDKRRKGATCSECGVKVKRGTARCRACHLARLNAAQREPEAREAMRAKTRGVPKTDEVRAHIKAGAMQRPRETLEPMWAATRGKPGHSRLPVGTERMQRGRVIVKCDDGKWRLRSQVMWEAKHGPVPKGFLVHHINFDPLDDRDDNFRLMKKGDHTKLHRIWESSSAYQPKKE